MRINKFLLPLILLVLAISSCESWLDVSPKADVKAGDFYEKESGYRDGLIGVYSLMTTTSSYGRDMTYTFMDILAQYYENLDGYYGYFKYSSKYEWESSRVEARLSRLWNKAYKGISNLNSALEYIDDNKSVFSSEETYKVYKGENLALRALLHFDMLRLFAPSPVNGINAMAIPYVKVNSSVASQQLSIEHVVAEIEKDLLEAKELMKDADPYGPNASMYGEELPEAFKNRHLRMNYYAAVGLLARVYNYVGFNEKAMEQVVELTGKTDGSLRMPDVFALTRTAANVEDMFFNSELIFGIQKNDMEDATEIYFFNEANDYYRYYVLSFSYESKMNMLGDGIGFRDAWVASTEGGANYSLSKYIGQSLIPMIKLSEMFLIAAECSDNDADKLWYLNKIRKHRSLTPITDISAFEEELHNEYRREFIGEGQLYYFYKRKLYSKIGSSGNVEVDINKAYNAPIPKNEIEFGNYN